MQGKAVADALDTGGLYQPDITKSPYCFESEAFQRSYELVLESFNKINGTELPGIVFAFAELMDDGCRDFADYEAFMRGIRSSEDAVGGLWDALEGRERPLVYEIEYPNGAFNPIAVEFNNFSALVDFVDQSVDSALLPCDEEGLHRIYQSICTGALIAPYLPSGLVQLHLPHIDAEHVVGVHPMFEI